MRRRSFCLFFFISLLALAAKKEKPRDSAAVFELLKQGAQLSATDAATMEKDAAAKPDESSWRIELLSYYANQTKAPDWAAVRAARLPHILWVIAHDPKEGFGLFHLTTGVYRVHCQGDDLADVDGFEQVSRAWLEQVERHPKEESIFAGAISAIQYCKPAVAERMVARDTARLGQLYANAVLGLNGESYVNNDAGNSVAELRQSEFAKKAYAILDRATDAAMLESAALTMLNVGAELWADGKLDWDYTPFGSKLLAMARAAGAHSMLLQMLSTTLPQRGERPPVMLRIGGNMMAKNLVKKVTPRYPAAAKQKMISGTVRLKALIGLDGAILDLEVVSGPAELIDGSVQAARQWAYKPVLLNGKPVYVLTQIDINYDIRGF